MSITDLLQPIKQRLEAATPGPWFAHQEYIDMGVPDAQHTITDSLNRFDGKFIAAVGLHSDVKHANSDLIRNAPTDQARLIAAIESAEQSFIGRAESYRETADRLNQQVIDRDPDRDPEAAARYSHYASAAESALQVFRIAITSALGSAA